MLLCLALAFSCLAVHADGEYRMLWVDAYRHGFRTPQDVDMLLNVARTVNYNAVVVEVRKVCDAFYNSSVEPKSRTIDAAFDPLAYLIRRAHDTTGGNRRIEVHAWLVTYRCRVPNDDTWRDPRHVFQRHPDWLSQMRDGSQSEAKNSERAGWFHLDPGVPQVVDHIVEVVRDLLSNYDVDGITFDYLRYPESKGGGNQWGYNPTAVARFNTLYGRTGRPAADDPQFCEFRRQQIRFLLRKVYAHVRAWRPLVKVSAALIAWGGVANGFENTDAYGIVMQDWLSMAQAGFLDIMLPMNYKRESVASQAVDFRGWTQFLAAVARQTGRFGVNVVDGESLNTLDGVLAQVRVTRNTAGLAGVSTYSYGDCRKDTTGIPDAVFYNAVRKQLFPTPAPVPEPIWLTRPTEGWVKGVVASGNRVIDGAVVRIGNQCALTDGSGFYAFARVRPGTYRLRVEYSGRVLAEEVVDIQAGKVVDKNVIVR